MKTDITFIALAPFVGQGTLEVLMEAAFDSGAEVALRITYKKGGSLEFRSEPLASDDVAPKRRKRQRA